MHLAEASFPKQHQQKVALVEHRMTIEATLILIMNPFQLPDMQVALSLQFLHLQLQIGVLLLQSRLP